VRLRGCALLAIVYIGAAELAHSLQFIHSLASIIWPPAGIGLAALLLYGPRLWPGIALGTFVTVILHVDSWFAAAWITATDVSEALIATFLLRRVLSFHTALDRVRDVIALAIVAFSVALPSAGLSVTGLSFAGAVPGVGFNEAFSTWWWGHLSGDLVIAPLILTWGTHTHGRGLAIRVRPLEVLLLACAVLLLDISLFSAIVPSWLPGSRAPYYMLPLLLWAGLRFGPRGAATASFAVSLMAIASTAIGGGPFVELSELQSFVSISSLTTLLLSAMALERLRAVQRKSAMQLATLDAIVSIDTAGRLVEVNPAAERMLGFRAADVLGRPADEVMIPSRSRSAFRAALHAYLARPGVTIVGRRYRAPVLRADGTELPVEIAVANVTIDGELTITGFIRDLTAELTLARAHREANELLENKVQERTAELMRINRVLERSEELLRQAESLAHLGSFQLNVETGELQWSDELFRIYGRDRRTYTPTLAGFLDAVSADDRPHVYETLQRAIHDVTPFGFEERIVRPDGSMRVLHSRGRVFKGPADAAARVAGCCQDVTEQKIAEEARYRLVDIAESSEDAIVGLSVTGVIETWNAGAAKIFGYTPDEVIGRSCTMLVRDDLVADLRQRIALAAAGEHLAHYDLPHLRKDGTSFDASVTTSAIRDHAGHVIGLSKVLRDISEQKSFENQLKLSLHEKEVLLREIHHRVKNNLQVISSLLNLQVSAETSEQARKGLVESQSRIQSMALVHQQLYQSRDLARIDFSEYLRNLATRLLKTYNVGPERIELEVSGPRLELDIDRAIPCGLIVNELLANAIDHAFPDGMHGHIWVTLDRRSDSSLELDVRDDGVGIPPELDLDATQTFGLQIARTLTRQLEGTIELVRDHGTLLRIVFPDAARASSPQLGGHAQLASA
jgi:PAS domain S-box-containing protein